MEGISRRSHDLFAIVSARRLCGGTASLFLGIIDDHP